MTKTQYDVAAIGAAIVDVIASVEDSFVTEKCQTYGLNPGAMTLIDQAKAVALYDSMPPAVETSGGSAGNTMAGVASFGGSAAFIGTVGQDQLGTVFAHDMKSIGVDVTLHNVASGEETSRCLILVAPNGDRTMNTYLGASGLLGPDQVDKSVIQNAAITYLEGYLFDPAPSKAAFRVAADMAHKANRLIALSLSDPFCVERHRDDFLAFLKDETDILFANEAELKSLYQTDDFDAAMRAVRQACPLSIITRSAEGSVIVTTDQAIEISAEPVAKVIDTTGAGDQYAAGFLFGYARGMDLGTCGALASKAAAEVISHIGPRPQKRYAEFIKQAA